MAIGADYSFELIFNETCAPQFNGHNNSFLASVELVYLHEMKFLHNLFINKLTTKLPWEERSISTSIKTFHCFDNLVKVELLIPNKILVTQ